MSGGSFPFLSSLPDSLPSLAPIEELAAEVTEKIVRYLTRQDLLNFRKASRSINEVVSKRTPALCPPDKCHLQMLRLHQLCGTLHISSLAVDLPMAQHLVPLSYHAKRTWKRWAGEKVDCFATFAFPPTSSFALFESATIGHLEVAKHLPIYVEGRRLQQLQQMLVGCTVDKTTLIFDKQTMPNLHSVPPFLRSLSCPRVEFVLEKCFKYDMLRPFCDVGLLSAFVASGVIEVTLAGVPFCGRAQRDAVDGPPKGAMETENLHLNLIYSLFAAGLKCVDFGKHTLENGYRMTIVKLLELIDGLLSLRRPLELRVHFSHCIPFLPPGSFALPQDEDEEWTREMNVEEGDGGGQRITIEIGNKTD